MTRTALHYAVLVLLIPLNLYVWVQVAYPPRPLLSISFLDVGQGDAILIESPSGNDILIDGGPDRSVLRQLPKEMGILDRTIDLVIATHPDKDHIAGLVGVFERYAVGAYLESGVEHDSPFVDSLNREVAEEPSLSTHAARRGMRIHMGSGAYADVLYPDRSVADVESNTGSIVMRMVYGDTSFMLTGDAPAAVEEYVTSLDGRMLESTVLKAGHHGSKTSTSASFIDAVDPQLAIVSAGRGNSYGHPAPEVLARLEERAVSVLSTIDRGTIVLRSDGAGVWAE